MTTRALERLDEWESEPFSGGYRALHDLASEDFSGIVTVGSANLCMLKGTVVGILDGSIEDFEDGEGTVAESPSPALPLLALMQDRNDQVKAQYYTEDTPISEVDSTLSDGGFSGYIELSENVLSGDYYLVYHAGRSMAVAFVGNSKQLLTDDEAFERADDEVGIYQVRPAEVEPIEIPEPEGEPADAVAAGATGEAADDAGADDDEQTTEVHEGGEGTGETAEESVDDAATQETADADSAAGATPEETADADSTTADDAQTDDAGEPTGAAAGGPTDDDAGTTPADSRASTGGTERTAPSTTGETRPDAVEGADATDDAAPSAPSSDTGGTTDAGDAPGQADEASSTGARVDSSATTSADPGATDAASSERQAAGTDGDASQPVGAGSSDPGSAGRGDGRSSGRRRSAGGSAGRPVGGADRLETHTIPSLDPSRSVSPHEERAAVASAGARPESGASGGSDPGPGPESGPTGGSPRSEPATDAEPGGTAGGETSAGEGTAAPSGEDAAGRRTDRSGERTADSGAQAGTGADARVSELEDELATVREELDRVETELAEVESERDDLRDERDALRRERDDLRNERDALESDLEDLRRERDDLGDERDALRDEVEELESEAESLRSQLEEMEAQFGASPDAEQRLTPAEALEQTDIFVRYESKGKATLETAHDGNASREQVNQNLGLEYHTQFDAANTAVAGKSFDAFLTDTIQYRFVTWMIQELLYEIRDTGKVAALRDLYDAIPRIDRAELNGTVSAEFSEDGGERRTQESFDVVMRDRMGNPLFVANLNDSRQAATETMMTSLVTAGSHVGESTETLGAAFLVTSSFFEPEALETAAEATSGGLLSRDKRESFVKLSRKQGYHLCLVEAREGKFHLAVPEL